MKEHAKREDRAKLEDCAAQRQRALGVELVHYLRGGGARHLPPGDPLAGQARPVRWDERPAVGLDGVADDVPDGVTDGVIDMYTRK